MSAIVAEDLGKTYRFHRKAPGILGSLASLVRREMRETKAVSEVSFKIEPGEFVGFLGPNGAGKTTTLKMLCGLLYPTTGMAHVLGHVPSKREPEYLRQIALVMGQKNMLWWDIPALETLLLHKELYRIDKTQFERTVDELSELLDLKHLLRVQVRKLSLGERMKMELLASLIHQPKVLFLDEPTIGLDVVSQQRVREFLRRLNAEHGTTILLTSHYMADIEQLCSRVLVIDGGRLGFDGPLARLVADVAPHKTIRATFTEAPAHAELERALGLSLGLVEADPRQVEVAVPRERVAEVTAALLEQGQVLDLLIEEAPVESIIRDLFSSTARTREER